MYKVLLVDDNQQFSNILENFLKEKGDIEVVGVADIREDAAVETAKYTSSTCLAG